MACDQSPVRGSISWVVEALVSSVPASPVSQYASRSGMSSRRWAAARCGGAAGGGELVDGVERQVLEAGGRVQLGGGHASPRPSPPRRRCGRRGSGRGCRAARRRRPAGRSRPPSCRCRCRSVGRWRPGRPRSPSRTPVVQGQDVPVQPSRQPHRPVGEAVRLVRSSVSGADPADHDPAAGRAEVDGGATYRAASVAATRSRARQRRNAAATPASTGMCRPVVWVRSPPVSAKTAFATCSGSTSRLSRVRWA